MKQYTYRLALTAALSLGVIQMLSASWAILPSVVDAPDEWLVPEPPETPVEQAAEPSTPMIPLAQSQPNIQTPATATASPPKVEPLIIAPAASPAQSPARPLAPSVEVTASADTTSAATEDGSTTTDPTEVAAMETPSKPLVLPDNAGVLDQVLFQHMALYQELRDDDVNALADIGLLWQTAIERSGTIRFAIEKLSRKNAVGDDPNQEGFAKQMVRSLARLGGAAGSMWTGTPAGLIGGDMVTDIVNDNGAATSPLTQVTDADMVLLAKEVESLQSELIDTYYGYRHARTRYTMAEKARDEILRYETIMNAPGPEPVDASKGLSGLLGKAMEKVKVGHQRDNSVMSPEWAMVQPLVASVSESLSDDVIKAQQELLSAREALVLMVGNDAVTTLEQLHTEQQGQPSDTTS